MYNMFKYFKYLILFYSKEIIEPAVDGTLGILKSALKFGYVASTLMDYCSNKASASDRVSVKRIIVTSSCAAVKERQETRTNIDETSWNESSIVECEEKGKNAHPLDMYSASKTIAEKREAGAYESWSDSTN